MSKLFDWIWWHWIIKGDYWHKYLSLGYWWTITRDIDETNKIVFAERERYKRLEKKYGNKLDEPPDGFCYATTEELALELGSSPEEAKAVQTRIERLTGNDLKLVKKPPTA